MLKNVSIKTKLYSIIALAVLAMFILAGVDFYSVKQGSKALESVYERQVVPASLLIEIDKELKAIRFRMAGYLVDQMPAVGNTNHLKEVRKKIPDLWAEYKERTKNNKLSEKSKVLVKKIDKQMSALAPFLGKLEEAYLLEKTSLVAPILEDQWPSIHGGLLKPISKLLEIQQQTVKATYDKNSASGKRLLMLAVIVFVVAVTVMLGFAVTIISAITSPLSRLVKAMQRASEGDLTVSLRIDRNNQDEITKVSAALNDLIDNLNESIHKVAQAADVVYTGSKELNSVTENLALSSQEQASSLEETAASMEEMTSTVKHNAANAMQADQLATESRAAADEGISIVSSIKQSMGLISDSSNKIADITGVIDGIAFQTNLLALNAAVEAAHAGKHGRGFTVVASEVRNLAQRSATAAKEIKALIKDSVEKAKDGAHLVGISGSKLEDIVIKAKQVAETIAEISVASQEQASGIDQVNRAIVQMDTVTQSNTVQVEELSSTSQSLASQGDHLKALVSYFTLNTNRTNQLSKPAETGVSAATPQADDKQHDPSTSSKINAVNTPPDGQISKIRNLKPRRAATRNYSINDDEDWSHSR